MYEFCHIAGKTVDDIRDCKPESGSVTFRFDDGTYCTLGYHRGCCESPHVDDVAGNLDSLVGQVVVTAEEHSFDSSDGSLWTFHRISTGKGAVTIRWRCNTDCRTDGSVAVNFY